MEKANSNGDKPLLNVSDDEEVSQDSPQIHTVNEQADKKIKMLETMKNFFKNHALGKNSVRNGLNENKNKMVKSEKESIKNYKNTSNQLLVKNGRKLDRNVDDISGRLTQESGGRQTNDRRGMNRQFTPRDHALESDRNNVIKENTQNGSLHDVRSPSPSPSASSDRIYENLVPSAPFSDRIYENLVPSKPQLQRVHGDSNPRARVRDNREETIHEGLVNERRESSFVKARAASPNVERRRNSSTGLSGDDTSPFRVMRFIRNNMRRISLLGLHSGGVLLLNNIKGRNVKFAELRADMDPIRVDTPTQERISNARLMSGGIVVLEGFSDGFDIPDFSRIEDPIVFDISPDHLRLPETSQFKIAAPSTPPVFARSHSGGGLIEVVCSAKASLPELFPTKRTPPKRLSLHKPHSGGGIVEPDDVQNQIFLDLHAQIIRFDVCQTTSRTPAKNDHADSSAL